MDYQRKLKSSFLLLVAALLFSSCASQRPHYYWGHYETLIYDSYTKGKSDPFKQIEVLEADYQKARAKNLPVPPGFHAHLGFLYYQAGKRDEALKHFDTEKVKYPESEVLMNRFLKPRKKM